MIQIYVSQNFKKCKSSNIVKRFLKFLIIMAILFVSVQTQCPESCLTCSNNNSCTSCVSQSNLILINSSLGCLPCPSRCQKCVSQNSTKQCTSCSIGYYSDPSNSSCLRCQQVNCRKCNTFYPTECLQCQTQYFLQQSTATCKSCSVQYPYSRTCRQNFLLACIQGYFTSNGQLCLECSQNLTCKSCVSAAICSQCYDGFYLSNYKCLACDSSCKTCNSNTSCSSCNKGFRINSISKCQACSTQNCVSCTILDVCQECNDRYYMQNKNKTCVVLQSSKYTQNCSRYASNYKFSITSLLAESSILCRTCMNGTYLNNQTSSCQYCSILCESCGGMYRSSKCALCVNSYARSIDSTNGICSPKTYALSGQQKIIYITNRNNLDIYAHSGKIKNYPEAQLKCPGGILASRVTLALDKIVGYQYKFHLMFLIQTIKPPPYLIDIYLNQVLLLQIDTSSSNVSSIQTCSQLKILKYSFNLKVSQFQENQTIIKDNQSNILTLMSILADEVLIDVRQMIIMVKQCHQTCGLCRTYQNCSKCKDPSYFIEGQKCVSKCESGYFKDALAKRCILQCPKGMYQNIIATQWTCEMCDQSCQICTQKNNCLSCAKGYFLIGNICSPQCPQFYFKNTIYRKCQKCISPCFLCLSIKQCISCAIGFHFSANNTCLINCPYNYYENLTTINCQQCLSPCYTCKSYSVCLSCSSQSNLTYFNYQCLNSCPQGSFPKINPLKQYACQACEFPCRQCIQNANKCTKCTTGFLLDMSNTCVSACPNKYFSSVSYMQCLPCSSPCQNCKNSQKICLSCQTGYLLNLQQNSCLKQCSLGYHSQASVCKKCKQQCRQCKNQQVCTQCSFGYYLQNSSCLLQCYDGFYKSLSIINATNEFFKLSPMYICQKCSQDCKRCFAQPGHCLECQTNYFLLKNNTCSSLCNQNSLSPGCLTCQYPCYSCQKLINNCTSCQNGYFFYEKNNQCVTQCYEGQYKSLQNGFGYCRQCQLPCSNCLSLKLCYSCTVFNEINYYLQTLSASRKTCVENCSIYQYKDQEQLICMQCLSPCLTCLNATFCTTCENGVLINGNCISKIDGCPIGSYALEQIKVLQDKSNLTLTTCIKCPTKCSSCQSQNKCTGCAQNFYLLQEYCADFCPLGTIPVKQLRKCIYCQYPCVQCSNTSTSCTKCAQIQLNSSSTKILCPQSRKMGNQCIKYYLFNNQCITQCSFITYPKDDKCLPCLKPCSTCQSQTFCTSCISGTYMLQSKCYKDCPLQYYQQKANQQCEKCPYPCKLCENQNICVQCRQGYLYKNKCLVKESCPVGYFQSQGQSQGKYCAKCSEKCIGCFDSKQNCLQCNNNVAVFQGFCYQNCPDGYYTKQKYSQFFQEIKISYCQKCPEQCLSCRDEENCQSCVHSYFLLQSKCVKLCPPNYMQRSYIIQFNKQINYTVTKCSPCEEPCFECFLEQTFCESCVSGYYMYEKKCLQNCPQGTYLNRMTKNCKQCPFPCKTCEQKNGDISCLECVKGYYVDRDNCVDKCQQGEYIDINGKKCVQNCQNGYKVQHIITKVNFCVRQCYLPYLKGFKNQICAVKCEKEQYINAQYQCVQYAPHLISQLIPKIKSHLYVDDKGFLRLYIQFSREVMFTDSEPLENSIEITKNAYQNNIVNRFLSSSFEETSSSSVDFSLIQQSQSTLIFQLYPKQSIYSPASIRINFIYNSNLYVIDKVSKIPVQSSSEQIEFEQNQRYQVYEYRLVRNNKFGQVGQIIIDFVLILALIMLVFNRYAKIYHFLIFVQSVFMIVCLNLSLPPNLYRFLQGFRFAHFYQFGNFLLDAQKPQKYTDFQGKSFNRIQSIFGDVNFITISGHLICLYLVITAIFLAFYLTKYLPYSSNQYLLEIRTTIAYKLQLVRWSHITDIFISTFMLILGSFLFQTIDYSSYTTEQPIGISLSYVFLLMLLSYMLYFIYKNYKIEMLSQKQPQKFVKKQYLYRQNYSSFFQGISTPKNCYKNYLLVFKIVVYGIFAGIFWNYPNFALSVWIVLQVIYSMVFIFKMPYSDQIQNYLYGACGFVYAFAMILVIIVNEHGSSERRINFGSLSQEQLKNIQDTKYLLGYFIIILILICTFILIIEMIISIMRGNLKKLKLGAQDEEYKQVKVNSPNNLTVLGTQGPKRIVFEEKRQFTAYSVINFDNIVLSQRRSKQE